MRHFLFGIHCHQPLDNFHYVVDAAIAQSYLPFLRTAARYENFKFAVHYSGWLLEYIKDHNAETFELLQHLGRTGQAEFFSGGFYEPILAAIPSQFRRLQITKLNDFIAEHFGQQPRGLWLTERVWDASIIPDLTACGIEYVIVDDYHFIASGFAKENLYGYYETEQDGCRIKIFPIDQKLRYIVPYKEPEAIDAYLQTVPNDCDHAAVIFDDGEKFGLWPDSHEWVYERGWLTRFLDYLTSQQHITASHFKDFVQQEKPLGIVYLPSVSYHEMGEWSLFADKFLELEQVKNALKAAGLSEQIETFVKGSIWQNFLVKYPEANRLHKRGLFLALAAQSQNDATFNELVCKAQVNDALWHGIFGGLYLPNLRNNLYRYIIEAMVCLDKLTQQTLPVAAEVPFDFDGFAKVSLRTGAVDFIFDLRDNGQLVGFDNRLTGFNYQDTLARRKEGYHAQMLAKAPVSMEINDKATGEEGSIATIHEAVLNVDDKTRQYLHFDWYNRNSFVDHVVDRFDFEAFDKCTFNELSDLTNRPADNYELRNNGVAAVTFTKAGGIFSDAGRQACQLTKHYAIGDKDKLSFDIRLVGDFKKAYTYVLEFNFHFNDLKALKINGQAVDAGHMLNNYTFTISDDNVKSLQLTFTKEVELYAALVYTVSQSEKDVDLTAQGVALYVPFEFIGEADVAGTLEILG